MNKLIHKHETIAGGNTYENAVVGKPSGATKDDCPGMDEAAAVGEGTNPTAKRPLRRGSCMPGKQLSIPSEK